MLVRLACLDDAAAVRDIYARAVEHTAVSFEIGAPSVAEMGRRIAEHQAEHGWLVAVDGGAVIGYAYAGRFRPRAAYAWAAETSVYVAEHARRQGVGRSLYTALLHLLRAEGYHRALAGITLPNPGSVALHEAMGFSPVGVFHQVGWKMGAWHDVGWWQRGLAEQPSGYHPGPPRRMSELAPSLLEAVLLTEPTTSERPSREPGSCG